METILSLRGVTRRFVGMVAVDDVDLDVGEGEKLGIIGPNGAGKTTLFNLVAGQLRPNRGQITLRSRPITSTPVHRRVDLGLGRTFQVVRPLHDLSVHENVMIGSFLRHPRRSAAEAKAWAVLDEVELTDRAGQRAQELTLAARKRLEVARALATDPTVLLLDEVMAGLNPAETDEAISLFERLHAGGRTLVLIEHNLTVVRALCQRLVVLDHGCVLADGEPEEVLAQSDVLSAYLGSRR